MTTKKTAKFYCGTSNVTLHVPNKTHFPPEYQDKSRLAFYASMFNTVEVNSSFYKVPMARTVERWAAEVPDQFRFTFKLWRGITHAKELIYDSADLARFFHPVTRVGHKKGCILVQFPASIKLSYFGKVKRLIAELVSSDEISGWRIAVEFRDKSWYTDKVYQMLELSDCGLVQHDIPKSATPAIDMEAPFTYLRFHGEKGDYRGSYEDEVLRDHALVVSHDISMGKDVYAYFNNTVGNAVYNAFTLRDMYNGEW